MLDCKIILVFPWYAAAFFYDLIDFIKIFLSNTVHYYYGDDDDDDDDDDGDDDYY